MPDIVYRDKSQAVRLTPWAAQLLRQLHAHLASEIREHPERYPTHAGRRLTLSDVVVMLIERGGLMQ